MFSHNSPPGLRSLTVIFANRSIIGKTVILQNTALWNAPSAMRDGLTYVSPGVQLHCNAAISTGALRRFPGVKVAGIFT